MYNNFYLRYNNIVGKRGKIMNETINRKDLIVMKLLHYFITEKNYSPIILQGAEDEIWLENLDSDYKIVRIVSNYIHNDEQLNFDLFKTKRIVSKIKKKTFSFHMDVLSIYTDIGDNAHLDKKNDCMFLYDEKDLEKYPFIDKYFPDIINKLTFTEEGLQLFIKITNDINQKNKLEAEKAESVFKRKKPIVTYILLGINVFMYLIPILLGSYNNLLDRFCLYGPYIREYNEYYRLISSGFLHADIFHLLFNCYALYVLGSQLESYIGKTKYSIVYLFSLLMGSLMSITFSDNPSIGASGAIFGLMGSLLYFGYHYRVYLGTMLKSQIIPLIIINLLYGFMLSGIDNFAHIGGLLGGFIVTMALGIKYKSNNSEKINGIIITSIFTLFMIYMAFFIGR